MCAVEMRHILFFSPPRFPKTGWSITVKDLEGVRSNPPLRQNYLTFIENFEKSQEIDKQACKINKSNPFVNLNPLSRNPGSAPALIYFGGHRYDNSPNYCISFQYKQSDHRGLPISYF